MIVRKERPHPGAQLRITDADELRITAFATNTTNTTSSTSGCATAAEPARGPHHAAESVGGRPARWSTRGRLAVYRMFSPHGGAEVGPRPQVPGETLDNPQ